MFSIYVKDKKISCKDSQMYLKFFYVDKIMIEITKNHI